LKLHPILGLAALLLAGCVTLPDNIGTPITLIGIVTNPVLTGWYRDFCEAGQLTGSLPDCVQVGGEIYRATLLDARTPEGQRISQKLIIGFPAHALPQNYRSKKRIHLETSSDDFRIATGIEYFADEWDDGADRGLHDRRI
jgi:hypothetical protein